MRFPFSAPRYLEECEDDQNGDLKKGEEEERKRMAMDIGSLEEEIAVEIATIIVVLEVITIILPF